METKFFRSSNKDFNQLEFSMIYLKCVFEIIMEIFRNHS